MDKVLIVDADKCTGCRQCELACSMARLGEFNPARSNIRVLRNRDMDVHLVAVSVARVWCGECVQACLPGMPNQSFQTNLSFPPLFHDALHLSRHD